MYQKAFEENYVLRKAFFDFPLMFSLKDIVTTGSDYSSKDNKGEGTLLGVKIIHALRTDMKLIRDRTPASVLAAEFAGAACHNFFSKGQSACHQLTLKASAGWKWIRTDPRLDTSGTVIFSLVSTWMHYLYSTKYKNPTPKTVYCSVA